MPGPLRTGPLEELRLDIMACNRCDLSGSRTNTVPGAGPGNARIVLIGEAPGEHEDRLGEPFVGKSGDRLDIWLRQAGISRDDCFITNVLKCVPPKNRFPLEKDYDYAFPPTECWPWLEAQLQAIKPLAVILFGKAALEQVLLKGTTELADPVTPWVGRFCRRRDRYGETRFGVAFHPAYILRNKNPYEEAKCQDALLAVRGYVSALERGQAPPVVDLYEVRPAQPVQYQRRLRLFGAPPKPESEPS